MTTVSTARRLGCSTWTKVKGGRKESRGGRPSLDCRRMGKSQECEAPDYDFSGEAMRRVISNLKLQNRVIPFREILAEVLGG